MTAAIKGAARYSAGFEGSSGRHGVVMTDTEGFSSFIQYCHDQERARDAAERWQIKENKAVSKATGSAP